VAQSCALQSLTGEVTGASLETRPLCGEALYAVLKAMTDADSGCSRSPAIAVQALLCGRVSMARAAGDPVLGAEIAAAVRTAVGDATRACVVTLGLAKAQSAVLRENRGSGMGGRRIDRMGIAAQSCYRLYFGPSLAIVGGPLCPVRL
jgi:hypothetical protein